MLPNFPEVLPPGGTPDHIISADLVLKDNEDRVRVRIDHNTGSIYCYNEDGKKVFHFEIPGNNLRLGGGDQENEDGDVVLMDGSGKITIHLGSSNAAIMLGSEGTGKAGKLVTRGEDGKQNIFIDGTTATGHFGGNGHHGNLNINKRNNSSVIRLDGENAKVRIGNSASPGELVVKSGGNKPSCVLTPNKMVIATSDNKIADLSSGNLTLANTGGTSIELKGNGPSGSNGFQIKASSTKTDMQLGKTGSGVIKLNGTNKSNITLGVKGNEKSIIIDGDKSQIVLGTPENPNALVLDGQKGDMLVHNEDCAEYFLIDESKHVSPGTVMVFNGKGKLIPCDKEFDKKVAGVISGAGKTKPGILLGNKKENLPGSMPIALIGKTYCKVDASYAPIKIGDLLTTSSTPGHAMKAVDTSKAFGAVIGKAISSLDKGCGLIPIFVAIQ